MKHIQMPETLFTGNDAIDTHHKNLFDIVDKLHAHIIENAENTVVKNTVNRLFKYINFHFSYEVSLMESVSYPEIEIHKNEHEKCVWKLFNMSNSNTPGNLVDPEYVSIFLVWWLTEHIGNFDMKLCRYLHDQGHA